MRQFLGHFICIIILGLSVGATAQQASPKLTPDELKAARANEKRMQDSILERNAHPGAIFNAQQCRADAQRWTSDGTDKEFAISGGTGIVVNGQFRVLVSGPTPHLPMAGLIDRIYEMALCQKTDEEFQKLYNTYARLEDNYRDEREFRYLYFILNHNLLNQFTKEDADKNK